MPVLPLKHLNCAAWVRYNFYTIVELTGINNNPRNGSLYTLYNINKDSIRDSHRNKDRDKDGDKGRDEGKDES